MTADKFVLVAGPLHLRGRLGVSVVAVPPSFGARRAFSTVDAAPWRGRAQRPEVFRERAARLVMGVGISRAVSGRPVSTSLSSAPPLDSNAAVLVYVCLLSPVSLSFPSARPR